MRLTTLALTLLLTFALTACSDSSPEGQLTTINDLLNKRLPMTDEQQTRIAALVQEGQRLLQEGKRSESSRALAQALPVLKHAEDAALFNKSE